MTEKRSELTTEQILANDTALCARFEQADLRPRPVGEVDWRNIPPWGFVESDTETPPTLDEIFQTVSIAQNDYWSLDRMISSLKPLVERKVVPRTAMGLLEAAKDDQATLINKYWALRFQLYPMP